MEKLPIGYLVKKLTIGVDLATKTTGICVLDENQRVILTEDLKFEKFSQNNMKKNYETLLHWTKKWGPVGLFNTLINEINVYIELSKYGSTTAEMFSFYAGMWYTLLSLRIDDSEVKLTIEFLEPKSWQKEMLLDNGITTKITGNGSKISKRQQTFIKDGVEIDNHIGVIKDISRNNAIRKMDKEVLYLTEDQADAFNIAYYGPRAKKLWIEKEKKSGTTKTRRKKLNNTNTRNKST